MYFIKRVLVINLQEVYKRYYELDNWRTQVPATSLQTSSAAGYIRCNQPNS